MYNLIFSVGCLRELFPLAGSTVQPDFHQFITWHNIATAIAMLLISWNSSCWTKTIYHLTQYCYAVHQQEFILLDKNNIYLLTYCNCYALATLFICRNLSSWTKTIYIIWHIATATLFICRNIAMLCHPSITRFAQLVPTLIRMKYISFHPFIRMTYNSIKSNIQEERGEPYINHCKPTNRPFEIEWWSTSL